MKETGLLFSTPMVKAVLRKDNPKTQTRRLRGLERVNSNPHNWSAKPLASTPNIWYFTATDSANVELVTCPYGVVGNRLWVREAWRVGKGYDDLPGSKFTSPTVWYEADGNTPAARAGRYRYARFMPRWASRITLEITEVRVQQLQDISVEDAIAEGLRKRAGQLETWYGNGLDGSTSSDDCYFLSPVECYRALWDNINGEKAPWQSNPIVWCITFSDKNS